jgi:ribonuclease HI
MMSENPEQLPNVTIYTDGSCNPNPGPGGWAALLIFGKHQKTITGSEKSSTNNRMEITAAIQGLKALKTPSDVNIYTDSQYLKRGITEWLPSWRKRNWRRKDGALANADLWQDLDRATRPHRITWQWVQGHANNRYNELVDSLAKRAIPKK